VKKACDSTTHEGNNTNRIQVNVTTNSTKVATQMASWRLLIHDFPNLGRETSSASIAKLEANSLSKRARVVVPRAIGFQLVKTNDTILE